LSGTHAGPSPRDPVWLEEALVRHLPPTARPSGRPHRGKHAGAPLVAIAAALVILLAGGAALAAEAYLPSPDQYATVLILGLGLCAVGSGLLIGAGVRRIRAGGSNAVESVFDVLAEGIAVCNGMQVVAINSSLRRLAGIDDSELDELMITGLIGDADAIDRLFCDQDVHLETEIRARGGEAIAVEVTARTIVQAGASRRLLEIRDIRERKRTEQRVSFLAHHDALTALPNREVLRQRLAASVEHAAASGECCGVIWIDLDRFKEINDVHGHATGDRILRLVAEKLKFELPAETVVARLGGDEFVVLCEHIRDATEARLTGQQLRRLLNRPLEIDGRPMKVGASIGVAVFPDDASSADDLLKNADLALYHAKELGRGKCRHYSAALGRERQRRMTLIGDLRGAIENGEIEAHFQPLVRTRDLTVGGFEALSRWFHRDFGAIPPPEFVKLAEENGLINPLTDLIVRRAVAAASAWPNDVRVSVNVSPLQIDSELVDRLRAILTSAAFDPRRLELEVTEDVLIKDFEQTSGMFARLRGLGVQVAMDDFGAGYTSLGNLRQLNFNRIKIDRIFTADLPSHRRSGAIVRAMLVLARELNIEVTVEGVETAEQFAFLCAEGCQEIQGFLFDQPKPLAAFIDSAALHYDLGARRPPTAPAVEFAESRTRLAS
jgi:diguanylate cyclase (GGDEF)-like protein